MVGHKQKGVLTTDKKEKQNYRIYLVMRQNSSQGQVENV
jgi:hypothetical protein